MADDPDVSTPAARLTHLLWLAREDDDPRTGPYPIPAFARLSGLSVDTVREALRGKHKRGLQGRTIAALARPFVSPNFGAKAEASMVEWIGVGKGNMPTRRSVRAAILARAEWDSSVRKAKAS